ncbi:SRPBCC domain-containing protein, partial [Streptomyces sp. SID10244]|nr:SRPBCC domain-containing protein [Streptomyces sp. SID10244]
EFAAAPARIWQLYADPRQLEKIWGPPTYPATVVEHDFTPGGRVTYYMTSPEGEKFGGYWVLETIDEPNGFSFEDGFADDDFKPIESMPVSTNTYAFEERAGHTVATYVSAYDT